MPYQPISLSSAIVSVELSISGANVFSDIVSIEVS